MIPTRKEREAAQKSGVPMEHDTVMNECIEFAKKDSTKLTDIFEKLYTAPAASVLNADDKRTVLENNADYHSLVEARKTVETLQGRIRDLEGKQPKEAIKVTETPEYKGLKTKYDNLRKADVKDSEEYKALKELYDALVAEGKVEPTETAEYLALKAKYDAIKMLEPTETEEYLALKKKFDAIKMLEPTETAEYLALKAKYDALVAKAPADPKESEEYKALKAERDGLVAEKKAMAARVEADRQKQFAPLVNADQSQTNMVITYNRIPASPDEVKVLHKFLGYNIKLERLPYASIGDEIIVMESLSKEEAIKAVRDKVEFLY